MYAWSFYDLDGHHCEVFWMDPATVQADHRLEDYLQC